jgi:hypothetical protein
MLPDRPTTPPPRPAPIVCLACMQVVTHTGDPGWRGQLPAHDCPQGRTP